MPQNPLSICENGENSFWVLKIGLSIVDYNGLNYFFYRGKNSIEHLCVRGKVLFIFTRERSLDLKITRFMAVLIVLTQALNLIFSTEQ